MKLYTEEQVREIIERAELNKHLTYGDVLDGIFPIELPSDEEIDNHIKDDFLNSKEVHKYAEEAQLLMKAMCKAGALWMRDKIQGNEQ